MLAYFGELGRAVDAAWAAVHRDARRFPHVAAACLADRPVEVDLAGLVEWLGTTDEASFPAQADMSMAFGEPPVTVFQGRRFRIDVNLWASSTTVVHQHGFAGAFAVMHGSSLQSRYRFTERRRVNAHLRLGALELERLEVLIAGQIVEIAPESGFIHGLFHLDHPSATVVVRTHGEGEFQPQLTYDPPGVAVDSSLASVLTPLERRRLQLVAFLGRAPLPGGDAVAERILADAGPVVAYHLLSHVLPERWLRAGAELDAVQAELDRWFAALHFDDDLTASLREAATRKVLCAGVSAARHLLVDPTDRLVAAVLLNAPDRAAVSAFLARQFPDADPEQTLVAFIDRATAVRDPSQPALCALGMHADAAALLRRLVVSDLGLDALFAALTDEHGAAAVEASRATVARAHHQLTELSLFAPWFRG